jgi:long-chain acyl-CoA synthetase
MNLAEHLDGVVRIDASANALEFEHRWITWGQLAETIDRINGILDAAGIGRDAGVGMLLRNRPAHYAAILAMLISERCIVTINPMQPLDKVKEDLAKLRTPAVIADAADWQQPGLASWSTRSAAWPSLSTGIGAGASPPCRAATVSALDPSTSLSPASPSRC